MALVVQKFGGSSLADLEKLGSIADWVALRRASGDALAIVVSAMGKTTEGLLRLAREVAHRAPRLESDGAEGLDQSTTFEPPRRELDMLVSTGERVSMALLSIALQARGIPAVSFTGSQSGIITCGRHFDARILEVRGERVRAELERGKVVIVAGYQGMSLEREITTLGRGGSDTTAVALAASLAADRCEIYSDVDGVYSADPRRIASARHLSSIDYVTMEEMANAGARVLNAQAVNWAARHGLTLHARRTSDFVDGGSGLETRIEAGSRGALAVVANPALGLVCGPESARAALAEAAIALGLPVRELPPGGGRRKQSVPSPIAVLPFAGIPDAAAARALLERAVVGSKVIDGYAELSAIGEAAGDAQRREQALAELGTEPLWTWYSTHRSSVIVRLDALEMAERNFHGYWVESASSPGIVSSRDQASESASAFG